MLVYRTSADFDQSDRFVAHARGVTAMARRPHDYIIATAGNDHHVSFWNNQGQPEGNSVKLVYGQSTGLCGPAAIAWRASGDLLAVAAYRRVYVVSYGSGRVLKVVDFPNRIYDLQWTSAGGLRVGMMDSVSFPDVVQFWHFPGVAFSRRGGKLTRAEAFETDKYDLPSGAASLKCGAALPPAYDRPLGWAAFHGPRLALRLDAQPAEWMGLPAMITTVRWLNAHTLLIATTGYPPFRLTVGGDAGPHLFAREVHPHGDARVTAAVGFGTTPLHATADENGVIAVWDRDLLRETFHAHAGAVTSMCLWAGKRNEVLLTAGGLDGTVRQWTLANAGDPAGQPPAAEPPPTRTLDI